MKEFLLKFDCCHSDCLVDSALEDIDIEKISPFYKGKRIRARCIDVYDGDTFTVVHFIGHVPVEISIRIHGINAAEMKQPKDLPEEVRQREKAKAERAKAYLEEMILNKIITIQCIEKRNGKGKFGRPLAKVEVRIPGKWCFSKTINIAEQMLKKGLAEAYDGRKKKKKKKQAKHTNRFFKAASPHKRLQEEQESDSDYQPTTP